MYSFRTEYRNYNCLIVPFPSCLQTLQIQIFGFSSPSVSSSHRCTAVLKVCVLPARCCISHLYSCLFAPAGEACRERLMPGEMENAYYHLLSPVTYRHDVMQKEIFPLPTVTPALQPSLLWIGNELKLLSEELWSPKHSLLLPLLMSSWTGYDNTSACPTSQTFFQAHLNTIEWKVG